MPQEYKRDDLLFMQLKNDAATKQEILHFVSVIAKDAPNPSLMDESWVDKILKLADILVCKYDDHIVGWLVLYANDYKTKVAYLASLHVLDGWRQHHIASTLLEKAISICRSRKFISFTLYCNNPAAEALYKKNGFIAQHQERVPKLANDVYNYMILNL